MAAVRWRCVLLNLAVSSTGSFCQVVPSTFKSLKVPTLVEVNDDYLASKASKFIEGDLIPTSTLAFQNPVIVRYSSEVVDSHVKTARKAQELGIMDGVQNASASTCVGVVVVGCHSEEFQRQLIDDLTDDPHVEFASHTDLGGNHCATEEFDNVGMLEGLARRKVVSSSPSQATASDQQQHLRQQVQQQEETAPHIVPGYVSGFLKVPELEVGFARELSPVWRRLLSAALTNTTEDWIEITSVIWSGAMASSERPPRPHEIQQQHAGGALRASRKGAKVDFKVHVPPEAPEDLLRSIQAQLLRLHKGGRGLEHFDVALDDELESRGVSLPDWAKSHFGRPRLVLPGEPPEQGGDESLSASALLAMIAGFVLLVPVGSVVLMFCFMATD